MKFAFIPKGEYKIGQVLNVQGRDMRVESYSHTGKNVIVTTLKMHQSLSAWCVSVLTLNPLRGQYETA